MFFGIFPVLNQKTTIMKTEKLIQLASFFLALMISITAFCQNTERALVNTEYEFVSGFPALVDWVANETDSQNNLYLGGNVVNPTNGVDLQLMKYNRTGDLLWEVSWTDSQIPGDAYATSIAIGDNYEVYVAGAAFNAGTGSHDMVFLKYSNSGNLIWQKRIAGSGTLDNIPSDLAYHNSGLLFATGVVSSTSSMADLAAICLSSNNGQIEWIDNYDHAGFNDAGVAITISGDDLYITGGSGNSWSSWSILALRYTIAGNLLGSFTENSSGLAFSQPRAIAQDNDGNIVIGGYVINPGSNRDMKLLKMDDELNVIWSEEYDYHGLDEEIFDVTTDESNAIYFTGYVDQVGGSRYAITSKVEASGTTVWEVPQYSKQSQGQVSGSRILADAEGRVTSACIQSSNTYNFVRTYNYDEQGYLRWSRDLRNDEGHVELQSLNADNQGNYYVNGVTYMTGGQARYISQKLTTIAVPQDVVTDSLGQGQYMDHQVIVAFQPKLVNTVFVNDRDKHYTALEDFLPDSIVGKISTAYGEDVLRKITVEKIFKRITTNDSISISRNDKEVIVPPFFSRVLLHLPSTYNILEFISDMGNLWPDINYAEVNAIGKLAGITSDSYNENQFSLYPSEIEEYENASINVEGAWTLTNQLPEAEIRVGIFDSPVYWEHEDFGGPDFEESKVDGGFDFISQSGIEDVSFNSSLFDNHGTAVAGVIGALTDNELGIAGISGGDGATREGSRLYSYGVTNHVGEVQAGFLAEALVMGSSEFLDNPELGDALDLANFSLSFNPTPPSTSQLLLESFRYMWNNECAMVTITGNTGFASGDILMPASFPDSWILQVGGSGVFGSFKDISEPDPLFAGGNWGSPTYGPLGFVDFIAPCVSSLIVTALNPAGTGYGGLCGVGSSGYGCFAGTSAAAPHATGVAALLGNLHKPANGYPNSLGPEDYEEIIKISALDIGSAYLINNNDPNGPTYPDGPDGKNGHGRVDATSAIERVLWPEGHVRHLSLSGVFGSGGGDYNIIELFNSTSTLLDHAMYGLDAGTYVANQYLLELPFSFTLDEDQAIDMVWKRESASIGFRLAPSIDPIIDEWNGFELQYSISGNTINGTITTWTVEVIIEEAPNMWIPAHPNDLRAEISLLVRQDETLDTQNKQPVDFSLFPNPSFGEVRINAQEEIDEITVFDLSGKVMINKAFPSGTYVLTLPLETIPAGLYLNVVKLASGQKVTKKLIKL